MCPVFSYIPLRLTELTELYLEYSIKNLNDVGISPIIFSNKNHLKNKNLKYELIEMDIDNRFKKNIFWSYYKLKVLSEINFPFIHFDNDFLIKDFSLLNHKLKDSELNLCYKHRVKETNRLDYLFILNQFFENRLNDVSELNNTSIIGTKNYELINEVYKKVLKSIDENFQFFEKKYNDIPPITLNQQYLNNFFENINYVFENNPNYEDLNINGVCHMDDKKIVNEIITKKSII